MRHNVIRALALTALFTQSVCAAALPGKGVVVKPVQSSLAEESFQTELVNRALQKLGYDVQPTNEVDYNVAYTANGDATYLAVNWKPQMEEMYDHAGGDGKFYRRGTYIAGAAQGYLIDKKPPKSTIFARWINYAIPPLPNCSTPTATAKPILPAVTPAGSAAMSSTGISRRSTCNPR
ncbi:hypothetical protein SODG_001314 [Sodalis praecaptivus]|nr:hypothetical protein NVIRENTERO_02664 [Sodalis praecaptivus]